MKTKSKIKNILKPIVESIINEQTTPDYEMIQRFFDLISKRSDYVVRYIKNKKITDEKILYCIDTIEDWCNSVKQEIKK